MVKSLFRAIRKLTLMEILDITSYEEDYVNKAIVNYNTYNNSIDNLRIHRKRKYCEKYRIILNKGVPTPSIYQHTHHYRNNKPLVQLFFYLQEDNT